MMAGDRHVHLSHNPIGALMAYNIWASVIVIGLTGYMMTTITFFGAEWVEEVHEAVVVKHEPPQVAVVDAHLLLLALELFALGPKPRVDQFLFEFR